VTSGRPLPRFCAPRCAVDPQNVCSEIAQMPFAISSTKRPLFSSSSRRDERGEPRAAAGVHVVVLRAVAVAHVAQRHRGGNAPHSAPSSRSAACDERLSDGCGTAFHRSRSSIVG
jgi:hypothetical protein